MKSQNLGGNSYISPMASLNSTVHYSAAAGFLIGSDLVKRMWRENRFYHRGCTDYLTLYIFGFVYCYVLCVTKTVCALFNKIKVRLSKMFTVSLMQNIVTMFF